MGEGNAIPLGTSALAAPVRYTDVVCVPALPKQNLRQLNYPLGGPIWPDFQQQTAARFCRNGVPFDTEPPFPDVTPRIVSEPAFWGGFARPHFGHLISEHLSRLPSYHFTGKSWPVYFMTPSGVAEDEIPEYFFRLCQWFGVSRDRIRFLTKPLTFAELWVAPQSEQLLNRWPEAGYVEALKELASQSSMKPVASDILYVTRAGMAKQGAAAFAGENYLVEQLSKAGVSVLDPASTLIEDQIAAYAGARHIVFAEGSSVHGRQLLGRLPQRISILQRRADLFIARKPLTRRTRQLDYYDVVSEVACVQRVVDERIRENGLTFFDEVRMLELFREFGVDLSENWSQDGFLQSVCEDAWDWLNALRKQRSTERFWSRLGTVPEVLSINGLAHVLDKLAVSEGDSDQAVQLLSKARSSGFSGGDSAVKPRPNAEKFDR